MNVFILILKSVQLTVSLIIGLCFMVPQNLQINDEAALEGETGPEATISVKTFLCSKPAYDFAVPDRDFTKSKWSVKFFKFADYAIYDKTEEVRMTLGCLKYHDGDKSDCMCWNWQQIAFTSLSVVIVSIMTAFTTICDIVSIVAADQYHDAQVSCYQGFSSCICSLVTGVTWIITGIVTYIFVFNAWPYIYLESNDGSESYVSFEEEEKIKKFYRIPDSWTVALVLCFSFFVILLMEGVVYLGMSGTVENKYLDAIVPPEDQHMKIKSYKSSSNKSTA